MKVWWKSGPRSASRLPVLIALIAMPVMLGGSGASYAHRRAPAAIAFNMYDVGSPEIGSDDTESVIDIMLVYTPKGRVATQDSDVRLGVENTNTAFRRSAINARVRVVHSTMTGYESPDLVGEGSGAQRVDCERLMNPSDGYMDEVHALRDQYGADIVLLVTATGSHDWDPAGMGFTMQHMTPAFERWAFGRVDEARESPGLSAYMCYAVAQIMGAGFSRSNEWESDYQPYDEGLFLSSHTSGYITSGSGSPPWTIMAHSFHGGFSGLNAGSDRFTRGEVRYDDNPVAAKDNARGMRVTAPLVAAFRPTVQLLAKAGNDKTLYDNDSDGFETVTLNGSGSEQGSGGPITSYEWREGGALLATGPNPNLTLAVGYHILELTVANAQGQVDVDTVEFRVGTPPSQHQPSDSNLHRGNIIRVPADYPTIQAGIDAARNLDTVLVADGVYGGAGNRDINFNGKFVALRSENGPKSTIIDAGGNMREWHRGFIFVSDETPPYSVVDGFTVRGGYADRGAGIFCQTTYGRGGALKSASPTITNCIIEGNYATVEGGGFYGRLNGAHLTGNIIRNNSAAHGGGVFCYNSGIRLHNNVISGNSAVYNGGGIYYRSMEPRAIRNCTVAGNVAGSKGGGIYIAEAARLRPSGWIWAEGNVDPPYISPLKVVNTIIWENTAPTGAGIGFSPNLFAPTVSYSDVQDGWSGQGNIDADPLFVNPSGGDYRLGASSPCIDAADGDQAPGTDIERSPPNDVEGVHNTGHGEIPYRDMGAYEAGTALRIITTSLPAGADGMPYSAAIKARWGSGAYSWRLVGGGVPGLSLTGVVLDRVSGTLDAVIEGRPDNSGTFSFAVEVTDSAGQKDIKELELTVGPAPLAIVTDMYLPDAHGGVFYSGTVHAQFGREPYTWSIVAGALPPGVSLTQSGNDAVISGMPDSPFDYYFTLRVVDSRGNVSEREFRLRVNYTPDLTVAFSGNDLSHWQHGQTKSFFVSVWNQGAFGPATTVRFYLSRDQVLSGDDLAVGSVDAPVMLGSPVLLGVSIALPADWTGLYVYLIARINPDGNVMERDDDNNNTAVLKIAVAPEILTTIEKY